MFFNLRFLTSTQFSLSFFPSLYNSSLTAPNFCFLAHTPCCFFIKSALCPYSQHLSVAREHCVCCCAVVWYMCVFGHSVHSGEPDWSGRSKQREETWQRKHTCTQTHSQILERRLVVLLLLPCASESPACLNLALAQNNQTTLAD